MLEILLFAIAFGLFCLGVAASWSWAIGWTYLATACVGLAAWYARRIRAGEVLIDKPLFLAGIFLFIVADPAIAAFNGGGFPSINAGTAGNAIASKVGLIVSLYGIAFFLGNAMPAAQRPIWGKRAQGSSSPHFRDEVLFAATALSVLPFFLFGGGSLLQNIASNLGGRSEGYVAFATGGLGNESPVLALLGLSIPATAVACGAYALDASRMMRRVIGGIAFVTLVLLATALGSRSTVVYIVATIAIYYGIRCRGRLPRSFVLVSICALIVLLAIQVTQRERGYEAARGTIKSPLKGFELNRELTFIATHFGGRNGYLTANNALEQALYPLPDTAILFATNPIPRMYWEAKPVDDSFAPYNLMRTGATGFGKTSNITPTVPGRYYMKYGVAGVIEMGVLIGCLWAYTNADAKRHAVVHGPRLLLPVFGATTLFLMTRDFSAGRMYPFLFLLFFYYANELVASVHERAIART